MEAQLGNKGEGLRRYLLKGPKKSGKSSLLFDWCLNSSAGTREDDSLRDRRVLVCIKEKIEISLPLPVRFQRLELVAEDETVMYAETGGTGGGFLNGWKDEATLSRVGMKYVSTCADFCWYLASLQMLQQDQRPLVVAVDDIDLIAGGMAESLLHCVALLCDTANFLGIHVAATLTMDKSPRWQNDPTYVELYLDEVLVIRRSPSSNHLSDAEYGSNSWLLSGDDYENTAAQNPSVFQVTKGKALFFYD